MQDYQEAMVKSLVAVAWADGKVEDEETEVIDALISAFALEGEDADAIREFAKTPRTLDEIPLTELSLHDRRMLLQHAVIVTFIDGEQSTEEATLLDDLQRRLHLDDSEAKELRQLATARAQRLLQLM